MLIFIILLSSILFTSIDAQESSVLTLTNSNFTEILYSHSDLFVLFYIPQCPHCQKLHPEFEKAATQVSQINLPVTLAKLDASTDPESAESKEVRLYPTLLLFHNGEAKEIYNLRRNSETIVKFLKDKLKNDIEYEL